MASTIEEDIQKLQDLNRRLGSLLAAPELGCVTWRWAVTRLVQEMKEIIEN